MVPTNEDKDQNKNLSKTWDQKLNMTITEKEWPKIVKICFNTIKDGFNIKSYIGL